MAPRRPATAAAPLSVRAVSLRRSARLKEAVVHPKKETTARITKPRAEPKPKLKLLRYDCTTCGRNLAASSFPKYLATDMCTHWINTCRPCTKTWLTTQLANTTYDKLACPECPALMQNEDVKLHADADIYARFDELERKGIAEKTPGWRWCLNPKCRAGQVHHSPKPLPVKTPRKNISSFGTKKPKLIVVMKMPVVDICTCHECGAEACVTCDRPIHPGESCANYQKRKEAEGRKAEEDATLATIQRKCKPCPECKKNIEKNGGCDSMYCAQCRTQFCWQCVTTYQDIRLTGHAKGCSYARPGAIDPHAMPAHWAAAADWDVV